jgi:hypothetical protein
VIGNNETTVQAYVTCVSLSISEYYTLLYRLGVGSIKVSHNLLLNKATCIRSVYKIRGNSPLTAIKPSNFSNKSFWRVGRFKLSVLLLLHSCACVVFTARVYVAAYSVQSPFIYTVWCVLCHVQGSCSTQGRRGVLVAQLHAWPEWSCNKLINGKRVNASTASHGPANCRQLVR